VRGISAAKRACNRRRVEGIVRNFVARHAGHKTDDQKCMYEKTIALDQHRWTLALVEGSRM